MYDPSQIIISPVITEKSTDLRNQSVYTFKVLPNARKTQIREAIEKLFNVEVKSVNTSKVRGKARETFGRSVGKTPSWKKAYIRLRDGQKISILEEIK